MFSSCLQIRRPSFFFGKLWNEEKIIFLPKLYFFQNYIPSKIILPDMTMMCIRGWMQMVYCHMIYSPETEQNKTMRYSDTGSGILVIFTYKMVTIHSIYVLCAQWVLFVTPDSSSCLPCHSIRLLTPPLLVINCLSCSPLGGPGPPQFPHPGWPHFPQAPGTFPLFCRTQLYSFLPIHINQLSGFLWRHQSLAYRLTWISETLS